MKQKITWISDFFFDIDDIHGGAELVDFHLKNFLSSDFEIKRVKCRDVNLKVLEDNKQSLFVVSNFILLHDDCKNWLIKNGKFVIYEHDHKYLKTRDPSPFRDLKAPESVLQNQDFYASAVSVVCQTERHAKAVRINLGLENIVVFGGSVWSNEELDYLESKINTKKVFDCAVLESKNGLKNTKGAVEFAQKKALLVHKIDPKPWKDFVDEFSRCESFIFLPTVLETCSRVTVEARMLGMRVFGNKNISAMEEDWFSKKGIDLINHFREKNKGLKKLFLSLFESQKKKDPEITCILTLYRRPQNLQKQIDHLLSQTIKPKEIWVWQNYHNDNNCFDRSSVKGVDRWIQSDHNWKYFGRFSIAQMVETEYTHILDDDTMNGTRWHENALKTIKKENCLVGGVGVILSDDTYSSPHQRFGWPNPQHKQEEIVDLVGHSWFFKTDLIRYFWQEKPFTFETCEDLHFSAMLQKHKIKTIVPVQDTKENTSSLFGYELGTGIEASSHQNNHAGFYKLRDECVKHYLQNGWKRVLAK